MRDTLRGKTIQTLTLQQEKCANISFDEFQRRTTGAKIEAIRNRGKWIITTLSNGENILLSLGMCADILFFDNEKKVADKYHIKVIFSDGSGYTARFWWFGKFLLVSDGELESEPNTKDIAIDPFDENFICPACQKI